MPVKQLPLIGTSQRSSGQDTENLFLNHRNGYFNVYTDAISDSQKYSYVKRPAIGAGSDTCLFTPTTPAIYNVVGYAQNESNQTLWLAGAAASTKLYLDSVDVTPGFLATYSAGSEYRVTWLCAAGNGEFGANINFISLCADDGKGFVSNSDGTTLTNIVDADFTAVTTKTNAVGYSSYIFYGNYINNRIYNSDLNAGTSYAATSYITANNRPGVLICIQRCGKYLVAFKSNSVEFFEDQGNPVPGSPLGPVPELNKDIGILTPTSFTEVSDGYIWISRLKNGRLAVVKMSKTTYQIKTISTSAIDYYLMTHNINQPDVLGGGTAVRERVCSFAWKNKEFVLVQAFGSGGGSGRCFCFDNDLSTWVEWSSSSSDDEFLFGRPIYQKTVSSTKTYLTPLFSGAAKNWYELTDSYFKDYAEATRTIKFQWTSENYDFGNYKHKFCDCINLYYYMNNANSVASPTVTLTYYDTDSTTATGSRTAVLNASGSNQAKFPRLGSFRNRRVQFTYTEDTPMKWNMVDFDYNMGDTDQES
jgi:hypothetical protein